MHSQGESDAARRAIGKEGRPGARAGCIFGSRGAREYSPVSHHRCQKQNWLILDLVIFIALAFL